MTTVGYGDDVPVTVLGKFIGGMTAIGGVLTIALTLPAIVFEFTNIYNKPSKLNLHLECDDDECELVEDSRIL